MTNYNDIKNWLSSSVKNRFFFASMSLFGTAYAEAKPFIEAKELLEKKLTDHMTREEFIEWRTTWRAVYAKLTVESQMSKNMRSSTEVAHVNTSALNSPTYIASVNQVYVIRLKSVAQDLLDLRVKAKEYSVIAHERQMEAA